MRTLIQTLVGIFFGLALLRTAIASESDGLNVQVGPTVEIAASSEYNWFPTVHLFSDGAIMATILMWPEDGSLRTRSAYCISRDAGRTWSRRYLMGEDATDDGAWTPNPENDGAFWHLYTPMEPYPAGQTREFHASLTKFWSGGAKIAIDREVTVRLAEPMHMSSLKSLDSRISDNVRMGAVATGFPWGPMLRGLNGDLMAEIYYETERDPGYTRIGLLRSSDEGRTWNETATIAAVGPGEKPWPGMGREGPAEAGIVRLSDQCLYALFRTGVDGFTGQSWSSDDGKTWTVPTSTPYKGVAIHLRRLSSGILACTYGRPGPVTIMFNLDGTAKTWSHVTSIFSGMSTRYTDLIEIAPGKLLVVYDSVPYGWNPIPDWDKISRNVVYGTFVTVTTSK